jgi:hypothetical protein
MRRKIMPAKVMKMPAQDAEHAQRFAPADANTVMTQPRLTLNSAQKRCMHKKCPVEATHWKSKTL